MALESRVRAMIDRMSLENPWRGREDLPEVPRVQIPTLVPSRRLSPAAAATAAQRVITQLQYNFLPSTFFALQKNRPLRQLITTAQEIVAESLPIRCLEATFLAIYLTQHAADLERFPLAFKSVCNGKSYRHIVLVVRHRSMYGAIGLSRVSTLMDKPLAFASLLDLLADYAAAYAAHGHTLASIKVGLCFSHDSTSRQVPMWRFISTPVPRCEVHATSAPPVELPVAPTPPTSAPEASGTVQHGRRKGTASPAAANSPVPGAINPSLPFAAAFRHDASFAQLLDNFCDLLATMSEEYENGGEAVVHAQAVAARVGRTMERIPRSAAPPTHSAAPALRAHHHSDGVPGVADVSPAAELAERPPAEKDDDDSDTEDNAHRVSCVRQGISPLSRAGGQMRSASEPPPARSAGLVGRLRGEVKSNPAQPSS